MTVIGQVFGVLKRIERRLERIERTLKEVINRLDKLAEEAR